jgi:protein CpxP
MKKQIVLMAAVALIGISSVKAQPGGGFQRRTPEERAKMVHDKMDSAFKLPAAKLTQVDTLYTNYYKATDKMREDLMASGMDRDAMRAEMQEKMKPLNDDRDNKLKAILTEEQMKTWKDVIEPSMRPQRPARPGGGQ